MKKNVKNIILILIIVTLLLGLLGGCCCPTCPQENHPGEVEEIIQCLLLEWFRPLTPLATRWFMSKVYNLVKKIEIEWALTQIGPWQCCMSLDDIIYSIHLLDGYKDVPVGYVEYKNGERKIIIICKEEGEKKAFLLIDGEMKELICDPWVIDVVI